MDAANSLFPVWMPWVFLAILIWTLPWKGNALWRSARNGHVVWFIVMLLVNTVGILEIIYIFGFSNFNKKKPALDNNPS